MRLPPFRADHVGSLLRPPALAEASAAHRAGTLDAAITDAVRRQQACGLQSITDGEFRRDGWHLDFLAQLDGVTLVDNGGQKFRFAGHLRGGRAAIAREVYPDLDACWADVAAAYRVAIAPLAAAGCRYLQLGDITFAYLCDPKIRQNCRDNGDDPDALPRRYAEVIDAALAGRPQDMRVTIHTIHTIHTCRSNFKSAWVTEGGYDPVVEAMFSTDVDGWFMAFDNARAGGFEPLRKLPAGKKVVLGLVTTKQGELESADALIRRIEEAARVVPLDPLCLSPQCGFSSTHHGNALATEDQWRKLERVVEVARTVWG